MVDEKKRARNSILIGLFIGAVAIVIFLLALYMSAGMQ
jgi:predicted nucleic acid-binding Zn ribbon protein